MSDPSVLRLGFALDPDANSNNYVDLSQCASIVNRRFYRQGMNWVVSNIEIITDGNCHLTISKLPDSWILANAWNKSFELHQDSLDQVLDIDGRDILGKYADFKIHMDSGHEINGFANNLTPGGYPIAHASGSYDWDPSEYEVPNDPVPGTTTSYHLHAIGPSTATSKGMIAGYAASRSRPQPRDPNVVDVVSPEGWMRELFDVGDNLEEIREDIEDNNVSPPYLVGAAGSQLEFYPGGILSAPILQDFVQDLLITRTETSLAFDSSGPFMAPCGLLLLQTGLGVEPNPLSFISVFITLAPGPVKGLMAQKMQEMN